MTLSADGPSHDRQPFLSIVVPAYNEAGRIVSTLEQVRDCLETQPYTWEVVLVDDGSTDDTAALVREFAEHNPGFRLIEAAHGGKGWAVRHGIMAVGGQYRFLCDADLSMPIEQINRFLPPNLTGFDVAIGSREAEGARRFQEPQRRHLMGRFFNILVRCLAVPGVEDTQCGFKCFTAEASQELFSLQRLDGFAFDVEVLFLARKRRMKVVEVSIDWHYRTESKVRPLQDSLLMVRDVLLVRWRSLRGAYSSLPSRSGGDAPG